MVVGNVRDRHWSCVCNAEDAMEFIPAGRNSVGGKAARSRDGVTRSKALVLFKSPT